MRTQIHRLRERFTLIELLVVIAIIAVLAALLLPSLSAAKGLATQTACMNNQRQIALGLFQYIEDNSGYYPLHSANTHGVMRPSGAPAGIAFYSYYHYLYDYTGGRVPVGGRYNANYTVNPLFTCPRDGDALNPAPGAKQRASYGMVHYSGVNYNVTQPLASRWSGYQLIQRGSRTRIFGVDGASAQVKSSGVFGGTDYRATHAVPGGALLYPARSGTTPFGGGYTVDRRHPKFVYIAADLSVRTLTYQSFRPYGSWNTFEDWMAPGNATAYSSHKSHYPLDRLPFAYADIYSAPLVPFEYE